MKRPDHAALRAEAAVSEQGFWERSHADWMRSMRYWRRYAGEHHGGYGWWRNALEHARHVRQYCKRLPT